MNNNTEGNYLPYRRNFVPNQSLAPLARSLCRSKSPSFQVCSSKHRSLVNRPRDLWRKVLVNQRVCFSKLITRELKATMTGRKIAESSTGCGVLRNMFIVPNFPSTLPCFMVLGRIQARFQRESVSFFIRTSLWISFLAILEIFLVELNETRLFNFEINLDVS